MDLEKAEEPEIKLLASTGSLKKQGCSRKTSTSALLTMPKPLTVWITTDCFQIGEGVCQGFILSPCLFNLYAEYIMRNVDCMKPKEMKSLTVFIVSPSICHEVMGPDAMILVF